MLGDYPCQRAGTKLGVKAAFRQPITCACRQLDRYVAVCKLDFALKLKFLDDALDEFRRGAVRVLVATDVMARGIDVAQVSHVINVQVPVRHEEYVHRIGRTGRAMQLGQAITLVDKTEEYHIAQIEQLMQQIIPTAPLPEGLPITPTSAEEQQEMARILDWQRQQRDPSYQGAFHKKKAKPTPKRHKPGTKHKRR